MTVACSEEWMDELEANVRANNGNENCQRAE